MFKSIMTRFVAVPVAAFLAVGSAQADIDLRVKSVRVQSLGGGNAQIFAEISLDFFDFDTDFPLNVGVYDEDGVLRALLERPINPTACVASSCTSCGVTAAGVPVAGGCYGLLTPPGCACFSTLLINFGITGIGPGEDDDRWVLRVDAEDLLAERNEQNNTYAFPLAVPCVTPVSNTFTADRFSAFPLDRLQVVAHYDGNGTAEMDLHLVNPSTQNCCFVTISNIGSNPLTTEEYILNGYVPTGRVDIRNVSPNGSIDGVAFGLYWRDAAGKRWRSQSRDLNYVGTPNFMGGWPVAWNEATWNSLMPQLAGGGVDGEVRRRQAQMILSGAQMLGNGTHGIPTRRVPGDVDGDGCVDLTDLSILLSTFGACCP